MRRTIVSFAVTALLSGGLSSLTGTGASAITVGTPTQAAAQAEGFANSAAFNGGMSNAGMGMGPAQQNQAISGSDRDANGNLLLANGILSGAGAAGQQSSIGDDLN